MSNLVQFLLGLIFGIGLVIAGMSDPGKVIAFLDVATIPQGTWDASLAFVIAGGVLVAFFGYRMALRRSVPVFGGLFHLPRKVQIDRHVIIGPAIFGIGWGMSGFCPGPAFTALGSGSTVVIAFVASMLVGMYAARRIAVRQLNLLVMPAKQGA